MPTEEIPITSEPMTEQDVVALFHQLVAAGVIRGLKIIATSEHETYDGLYRLQMKETFDKFIFDQKTNPLGIPQGVFASGEILSKPCVLEYKFNVDGLIEEFEKEKKHEGDIDLVIAWEMGDAWKAKYKIIPLLHFDYIQHRFIHGATHLVRNASTGNLAFVAIILSELIRYLKDPVAEQEIQENVYLSD